MKRSAVALLATIALGLRASLPLADPQVFRHRFA